MSVIKSIVMRKCYDYQLIDLNYNEINQYDEGLKSYILGIKVTNSHAIPINFDFSPSEICRIVSSIDTPIYHEISGVPCRLILPKIEDIRSIDWLVVQSLTESINSDSTLYDILNYSISAPIITSSKSKSGKYMTVRIDSSKLGVFDYNKSSYINLIPLIELKIPY